MLMEEIKEIDKMVEKYKTFFKNIKLMDMIC